MLHSTSDPHIHLLYNDLEESGSSDITWRDTRPRRTADPEVQDEGDQDVTRRDRAFRVFLASVVHHLQPGEAGRGDRIRGAGDNRVLSTYSAMARHFKLLH